MTLRLVRHGRVDERVLDGSDNPGLSDIGRAEADSVARVVELDYLASSPMRRALETAEPIAARSGLDVVVVDAVGEVVPKELGPEKRRSFLGAFMGGVWSEQPPELCDWRGAVLDALADLSTRGANVVVVTHYVAINVAAGAALGDDQVTVFHAPNTSVSTFEWEDGRLRAVELGNADHLTG